MWPSGGWRRTADQTFYHPIRAFAPGRLRHFAEPALSTKANTWRTSTRPSSGTVSTCIRSWIDSLAITTSDVSVLDWADLFDIAGHPQANGASRISVHRSIRQQVRRRRCQPQRDGGECNRLRRHLKGKLMSAVLAHGVTTLAVSEVPSRGTRRHAGSPRLTHPPEKWKWKYHAAKPMNGAWSLPAAAWCNRCVEPRV